MDAFFQQSSEFFFQNFQRLQDELETTQPPTDALSHEDLIDDSDDLIHDRVMAMVHEKPRLTEQDFPHVLSQTVPPIK
jgi:hypothetical protein